MRLFVTALFLFISFVAVSNAHAQSLCVTRSGAVLRAGPQASAAATWKVPKYMPLQPTGNNKSGWIEVVDIDGQKHWVSGRDVSSHMTCLAVRSRRARLRTGPGTNFESSPIGTADHYSAFVDKGGEDGWTQVQDEMGQSGWINLDQIWKPHKTMRMSFDQ